MDTNIETIESPKECSAYPGFYHIPNFGQYVINQQGEVINLVTKRQLHPTNIYGYFTYPLFDADGKRRFCKRSRLLCTTFKPHPLADYLQIDHINCDKGDDRLENLEWVTSRENTQRAAEHDLCGKRFPIEVRDWESGQVIVHPTIASVMRTYGLTNAAVAYRLSCGDGRVFPEGKQYRYVGEKINWKNVEDLNAEVARYGNCKRVLLRDLSTGAVREYDTLSDAAKALRMSLSTLSTYLAKNEDSQPVLPGLYQLKFVADSNPWKDPDDPWLAVAKSTKRPLIQTINVATGEKEVFLSQVECARARGILTTTLNFRLQNVSPKTVCRDGFRYGYYPFD